MAGVPSDGHAATFAALPPGRLLEREASLLRYRPEGCLSARRHRCDVPGCGRTRLRWQRLCEVCWKALPGDIRTGLTEAFRQGRYADHRKEVRRAREFFADRDRQPAAVPRGRGGMED